MCFFINPRGLISLVFQRGLNNFNKDDAIQLHVKNSRLAEKMVCKSDAPAYNPNFTFISKPLEIQFIV